MASWRLLELTDASEQTPTLLIKVEFGPRGYTIFLTDLSYVWREKLDLSGIIERASKEESPIEVNQHDTTQLPILLENIQSSLDCVEGSTCHITRNSDNGIILHTTSVLPEPLDALRWKFYLQKDNAITLRNELVSPLLVYSQIQHRRITSLVSILHEKDKAISRLLDQYESCNLDLAAAFPSIGGPRSGRKPVRREQAMKLIPALQRFDETRWEEGSGQIEEDDFSPAMFFQESLPHHHLSLSTQLKVNDENDVWWTNIPKRLNIRAPAASKTTKSSKKASNRSVNDETTEDEFDDGDAFEELNPSQRDTLSPQASSPPKVAKYGEIDEAETTDDDDDDLDAPLKSQSQSQSQKGPRQSPRPSSSLSLSPAKATSSRAKGFQIGGAKTKKEVQESREASAQMDQASYEPEEPGVPSAVTQSTRKPFKIGGKQRAGDESKKSARGLTRNLQNRETSEIGDADHDGRAKEAQSQAEKPARDTKGQSHVPSSLEHAEETVEEKAERRRLELKRKNEELAKKQAQKKHKKRF